jgi:hypothetical protein
LVKLNFPLPSKTLAEIGAQFTMGSVTLVAVSTRAVALRVPPVTFKTICPRNTQGC